MPIGAWAARWRPNSRGACATETQPDDLPKIEAKIENGLPDAPPPAAAATATDDKKKDDGKEDGKGG